MRRQRPIAAALATALLAATAVLAASVGAPAAPSKSQTLFRTTLLQDAKTTTAIKRLLGDRGGFVAPDIQFADLTGDGRSDAIVLVDTGGIAGAVALYVFSTDGAKADSPLRAVYRSQHLYRAAALVSKQALVVRTPRFAAGDDVCCPAKVSQRVYLWSAAAKTLTLRQARELAGPGR